MNESNVALVKKLIPSSYVKQANDARKTREKRVQTLLEQRKLPSEGWEEAAIEGLLHDLAMMDSNNFPGNCGVGEREARIYSPLVASRHYRFGHGIGRSGDLVEVQPKAAGSSLLNKLANSLAADAIRTAGVRSVDSCFVVPVATGMAITLCLLALRHQRPPGARYVLWPRVDQKSCFKSIVTAGFEPIILQNVREGDELTTDVEAVRQAIERLGSETIVCLLSTTSCFAPRAPDRLDALGRLCRDHGLPHVVNNAYGLQSTECARLLERTAATGRLDAFVQSCDKNFLVPVGGAIVAGFRREFIESVSRMYPGRASASPSIDLFATLLAMGSAGYAKLLADRIRQFDYLKSELERCGRKHGCRLLDTPANTISVAVDLGPVTRAKTKPAPGKEEEHERAETATQIGAMLFTRCVSGTRVVVPSSTPKEVAGHLFTHFGSHSNAPTTPYLTAAAALGIKKDEIDTFIKRLDKVLTKFTKDRDRDNCSSSSSPPPPKEEDTL